MLFANEDTFMQRVVAINRYGEQWGSTGFRAGIMYRNQEWFHALDFEYDMSVPNVAHLEPQRGGCCTVMPYFIGNLVELPLMIFAGLLVVSHCRRAGPRHLGAGD